MSYTDTELAKFKLLADNAAMREKETESYQINIDNFTHIIENIDPDWPENLAQYQNTRAENLPLDLPEEDYMRVSELQFRAEMQRRIRAEAGEQAKTRRIYDAMAAQIPEDLRDELLGAARTAAAPESAT